jgi:hypothetical protein
VRGISYSKSLMLSGSFSLQLIIFIIIF